MNELIKYLGTDTWVQMLYNAEYAEMYPNIVSAVNTASEGVTNTFYINALERVKSELPNIELIKVKERGHTLTIKINKKNAERKEATTSFFDYVQAGLRHPDAEVREASQVLQRYLKKYGKWWINGLQDKLSSYIKQLLSEIDEDEALKEAARVSKVTEQLELMRSVQAEYEAFRIERDVKWAWRDMKNINIPKLRKSTWDRMRTFIKVLSDLSLEADAKDIEYSVFAVAKVMSRTANIYSHRTTMRNATKSKNENGVIAPKIASIMQNANVSEKTKNKIKFFDNNLESTDAGANVSAESEGDAKVYDAAANHDDGGASEQMPQAGESPEAKDDGGLNNAV